MKQKKGRHKPKELKKALYNIETLYKAGSSVTKYFDDCFSIVSEAKHASKKDASKIANCSCTSKSG